MSVAFSLPVLMCNSCPFCFQLTLTIVRQTGGLGISIAGGKGSTPYKGDDEVRLWAVSLWEGLLLCSCVLDVHM